MNGKFMLSFWKHNARHKRGRQRQKKTGPTGKTEWQSREREKKKVNDQIFFISLRATMIHVSTLQNSLAVEQVGLARGTIITRYSGVFFFKVLHRF